MLKSFLTLFVLVVSSNILAVANASSGELPPIPSAAALDAEAARAMDATGARGMAIAVIDRGRVVHVRSYGDRNVDGDPLEVDTVMYGASLTKAAFAHLVVQLAEDGIIDLDRPIADLLGRPLPQYPDDRRYAPWSGLAGDERWRDITPRILLTHSAGFANFAFLEPDGRLRIHFDPGTRYAYSGDGLILLQFVLERGLGLDVGRAMQQRVFDRFDMHRTSMTWREDFAENLADGWALDGSTQPHDERSKVRSAGSMDTTIGDMARLAAGYVRGDGLGEAAFDDLLAPHLPITTRVQFPTLQPEAPPEARYPTLAAALGVEVFEGPMGRAMFKGGHNDVTGNIWLCVLEQQRCVVILSNDVRAERAFPHLARFAIGETGAPWAWKYSGVEFWDGR